MASRLLLLATGLSLAACGGEPATDDPGTTTTETDAPRPTVTIVSPAEGDTVDGPAVTVQLAVDGLRIVLAGDTTPGTGHHHLYLDDDLTPGDMPIPTVPGRIIHMGDGSTEYTFEDVIPGDHRLIAVVGDGVHVPLQPWVVDTVHFTVRR